MPYLSNSITKGRKLKRYITYLVNDVMLDSLICMIWFSYRLFIRLGCSIHTSADLRKAPGVAAVVIFPLCISCLLYVECFHKATQFSSFGSLS